MRRSRFVAQHTTASNLAVQDGGDGASLTAVKSGWESAGARKKEREQAPTARAGGRRAPSRFRGTRTRA